jgi:hypothetical protein
MQIKNWDEIPIGLVIAPKFWRCSVCGAAKVSRDVSCPGCIKSRASQVKSFIASGILFARKLISNIW